MSVCFFTYLIKYHAKEDEITKKITIKLVTTLIAAPTVIEISSALFPILNKQVLGTNFGAVLSLIVVTLTFTLLAMTKFRENSPRNIGAFMPFIALSLYSTTFGLLQDQSWLVSLGMMIIQCTACLVSLKCIEVWKACINALVFISASLFLLSFYSPILENCRVDKCLLFRKCFLSRSEEMD